MQRVGLSIAAWLLLGASRSESAFSGWVTRLLLTVVGHSLGPSTLQGSGKVKRPRVGTGVALPSCLAKVTNCSQDQSCHGLKIVSWCKNLVSEGHCVSVAFYRTI